MESTTKKTVDSQRIYEEGNELAISEEPFGLAYDIDSFPKISMVHTLDRVPEMFEKRSTFIDIYSRGSLEPNTSESQESPSHSQSDQYIKQRKHTPSLNPIGSLKRGILYEAACNAKRFARSSIREMQKEGKTSSPCDVQSFRRNLRGAMKRKQNQRQRFMTDIKLCKHERPGFNKKRCPLSSDNLHMRHWDIQRKSHYTKGCDCSLEANENGSVNYNKPSDSKSHYLDEPTDDCQRKRYLSAERTSLISVNLSKREKAQLDVTFEFEHNAAFKSDPKLCDEYHCQCFTAEDCPILHQGNNAGLKLKRKTGLFVNRYQKEKDFYVSSD